jgi:hypothetical protein
LVLVFVTHIVHPWLLSISRTPYPPHKQGLVRLDVHTLSPLSSLPCVVVEHSTNDPPHEQWLTGLDVGAEAKSFVGLILVVSVLTIV